MLTGLAPNIMTALIQLKTPRIAELARAFFPNERSAGKQQAHWRVRRALTVTKVLISKFRLT